MPSWFAAGLRYKALGTLQTRPEGGITGPSFPAVRTVGQLKAGYWDSQDGLPCWTQGRAYELCLLVPLDQTSLYATGTVGSWPCFHFAFFECCTKKGWKIFSSFSVSSYFAAHLAVVVPVRAVVSNEWHGERGRTAGSLEGSAPKAETTEELRVRSNYGGNKISGLEARPDGRRANPRQSQKKMRGERWKG